jgi:hypothetical protein
VQYNRYLFELLFTAFGVVVIFVYFYFTGRIPFQSMIRSHEDVGALGLLLFFYLLFLSDIVGNELNRSPLVS